jgi:hypothetical protein
MLQDLALYRGWIALAACLLLRDAGDVLPGTFRLSSRRSRARPRCFCTVVIVSGTHSALLFQNRCTGRCCTQFSIDDQDHYYDDPIPTALPTSAPATNSGFVSRIVATWMAQIGISKVSSVLCSGPPSRTLPQSSKNLYIYPI